MKVTAVVPAKGDSERLSHKNLMKINGKSLVRIACEKLLKCRYIDSVYLDTESERIKAAVNDLLKRDLNIINRPTALATNKIGGNSMMVYHLHSVEETDVIVHHYCTAPLLKASTIDNAINEFVDNNPKKDSFLTVIKQKSYLWSTNSHPKNFDLDELPNSQDMPSTLFETHGLYGIYSSKVIETKRRIGNNPLLYEISKEESFDVNHKSDLEIARSLY
jgi:CMP-N-acetylneuraminic acid synthetase